jgi:hypothetical protein
MKHLKHTLATCIFHPSSARRGAEWRTAGFGQPATEDGGAAWQCGQLRLRLACGQPAMAPSPSCLATRGV